MHIKNRYLQKNLYKNLIYRWGTHQKFSLENYLIKIGITNKLTISKFLIKEGFISINNLLIKNFYYIVKPGDNLFVGIKNKDKFSFNNLFPILKLLVKTNTKILKYQRYLNQLERDKFLENNYSKLNKNFNSSKILYSTLEINRNRKIKFQRSLNISKFLIKNLENNQNNNTRLEQMIVKYHNIETKKLTVRKNNKPISNMLVKFNVSKNLLNKINMTK